MKTLLIIIVLVLSLSACYYDSEEALFPMQSNDTASIISYSNHIAPMLNSFCNSCHSSGNSVKLSTYNDVSTQADRIYGSITFASGYQRMPQGSSKLNDKYIQQFKKWMDQGKPNN